MNCKGFVMSLVAGLVMAAGSSNAAGVYDFKVEPMKTGDGKTSITSLKAYKGKVLLVINVASKCGFTKQYTGLEELYKKYKDRGLVVIGFPCNQFGGQEPGTEEEIVNFCKSTYDVTFPLMAKVDVKGANASPLFKYLTEGEHPGKGEIKWNFNKFLISRDGQVLNHFGSMVKPDSEELVKAVEAALEAK